VLARHDDPRGALAFSAKRRASVGASSSSAARKKFAAQFSSGSLMTRGLTLPIFVSLLLAISINGIQQWINVRGKDTRNPILLLLHGGPGSPETPYNWTFQTPWEDFFTVVEWDQRGAGKTYALNDPDKIAPTMTVPKMLSDTEQVIEYLRRTYRKQKIILVGHSWGSVLGVLIAQKHPDWLYAYVGVGQWVNTQKSEREAYAFSLSEARANNNAEALKEL
jgi:pimeloyl-ACP methyl ester carboxylesterase